ncbi:MAG TPA: hypothetical protein VEB42_00940 [Chitinophagaceae bacterium]|nr:hypothetical protein [Chitinophagaceae bacterium]
MQYGNVYLPVQDLKKAPVETGGFCSLILFKWDDVDEWPEVNPQTGIIEKAIKLKPGGIYYLCQAVETGRTYTEEDKEGPAGTYTDIIIQATLAGNTSNNTLSIMTMRYHRWGMIINDRDKVPRLVGNMDSGAKLLTKYTPEDYYGSRRRDLKWSWSASQPLPQYGAKAFPLNIGGVVVVAGSMKLLEMFQVGAAGSPMADGQTALTKAAYANKRLLILVDGVALPCDDGSGNIDWAAPENALRRRYQKTLASDTITFVGNVYYPEIIEIYEIS